MVLIVWMCVCALSMTEMMCVCAYFNGSMCFYGYSYVRVYSAVVLHTSVTTVLHVFTYMCLLFVMSFLLKLFLMLCFAGVRMGLFQSLKVISVMMLCQQFSVLHQTSISLITFIAADKPWFQKGHTEPVWHMADSVNKVLHNLCITYGNGLAPLWHLQCGHKKND